MQDGLDCSIQSRGFGRCILWAFLLGLLAKLVRCCGAHYITKPETVKLSMAFCMKIHLAVRRSDHHENFLTSQINLTVAENVAITCIDGVRRSSKATAIEPSLLLHIIRYNQVSKPLEDNESAALTLELQGHTSYA